jgi:hypothetical protein
VERRKEKAKLEAELRLKKQELEKARKERKKIEESIGDSLLHKPSRKQ